MILRPTPLIAMVILLGTAAWLPSPLRAAESGPSGSGVTMAQDDVMAPEEDGDGAAERTGSQGRDRWSRTSHDEDRGENQFDDDEGEGRGGQARGWRESGGHRSGGWDRRDREDRDGWSPERRRMVAMHARMMQMMGAGRQPAAAFRIEIGDTRMSVRCSPRETMRECADAALSVANRLREANAGTRPSGSAGIGAAPAGPGSAGTAPGAGNPSIGNPGSSNPGSSNPSLGTPNGGGGTAQ